MSAEAKARRRAQELCDAAEQFRRTGGVIKQTETVKALPADVIKRIEILEQQNLQAMQALQAVLQFLEDERSKRERLESVVLKIADGAEELLRKAG